MYANIVIFAIRTRLLFGGIFYKLSEKEKENQN